MLTIMTEKIPSWGRLSATSTSPFTINDPDADCHVLLEIAAHHNAHFRSKTFGLGFHLKVSSHLGVGDSIEDDHGVDVCFSCGPFLQKDERVIWVVIFCVAGL